MKLVGKVREAHGLKGDLYILVFSGEVAWLPRLKECQVQVKGEERLSLTVQKVKPFKKGFILKAPEVADRTAAEPLKGAEFFIPEELLVSKPGETIYLNEILEFTLKDVEQNKLGIVKSFSSNGAQDLLVVETLAGKKAEVPFVDAYIKNIDFKNKSLVMDLPEGILDLDSLQ